MRWFIRLSSAMQTRMFWGWRVERAVCLVVGREVVGVGRGIGTCGTGEEEDDDGGALGRVSEKETVVPAFSVLCSSMVPPMDSTSDLQMLRPRPLPPYFLDVLVSAWLNGLNSLCSCWAGMPIPVSWIQKVRCVAVSVSHSAFAPMVIDPLAVNFKLLLTRFPSI